MSDVIIVGGGAAGMYAAIAALRAGAEVCLLEKNDRLGRKLSITGKGRCNLTNACDRDTLTANIPRNAKFLYSAFSRCMPQDVMRFFEDAGVPLKIERGRRVFPQSDCAADIPAALQRILEHEGARILRNSPVESLVIAENSCTGVRLSGGKIVQGAAVILATGGLSYPRTGSQGDGYRLAREAGHTILPPQPSLVPLETEEQDAAEMQGLSLKNVKVRLMRGKKCCFSEQGEMLFTHFGLSGPLILSASAVMDMASAAEYQIFVDLKPALTMEQLDLRIMRDFSEQKNRILGNALRKLLPLSMIPTILHRAELAPTEVVRELRREQRMRLLQKIKALDYHITKPRPIAEAIITRGGVSVREVEPNTCASKKCAGLYFAGELLDVDAYTGGFNLQIAFATGEAAGQAAAAYAGKGKIGKNLSYAG